MLSTYAKLLQWRRYFGVCSTQVPHTYSVSRLLPSHAYWSSNRHRQCAQTVVCTLGLGNRLLWCSQLVPNCFNDVGIVDYALHRHPTHIRSPNYCHHMCIWQAIGTEKVAQIDVYTAGLEIRLLSCSQRVTNCCNDAGILDYALHRYPTHIRSPNCSHRMCICQAIVIQKSLKLTFIHSGLRFDWFCALNLCQTASIIKVLWSILYTGTPHIFALPTTVIACVFVKQ